MSNARQEAKAILIPKEFHFYALGRPDLLYESKSTAVKLDDMKDLYSEKSDGRNKKIEHLQKLVDNEKQKFTDLDFASDLERLSKELDEFKKNYIDKINRLQAAKLCDLLLPENLFWNLELFESKTKNDVVTKCGNIYSSSLRKFEDIAKTGPIELNQNVNEDSYKHLLEALKSFNKRYSKFLELNSQLKSNLMSEKEQITKDLTRRKISIQTPPYEPNEFNERQLLDTNGKLEAALVFYQNHFDFESADRQRQGGLIHGFERVLQDWSSSNIDVAVMQIGAKVDAIKQDDNNMCVEVEVPCTLDLDGSSFPEPNLTFKYSYNISISKDNMVTCVLNADTNQVIPNFNEKELQDLASKIIKQSGVDSASSSMKKIEKLAKFYVPFLQIDTVRDNVFAKVGLSLKDLKKNLEAIKLFSNLEMKESFLDKLKERLDHFVLIQNEVGINQILEQIKLLAAENAELVQSASKTLVGFSKADTGIFFSRSKKLLNKTDKLITFSNMQLLKVQTKSTMHLDSDVAGLRRTLVSTIGQSNLQSQTRDLKEIAAMQAKDKNHASNQIAKHRAIMKLSVVIAKARSSAETKKSKTFKGKARKLGRKFSRLVSKNNDGGNSGGLAGKKLKSLQAITDTISQTEKVGDPIQRYRQILNIIEEEIKKINPTDGFYQILIDIKEKFKNDAEQVDLTESLDPSGKQCLPSKRK